MSSRTPGRLSELRRRALWPSDTVARIAVRRFLAVLDRTPCELAAFREFVARIHQRMSAGELFQGIHESRSTYVVRLPLGGRDVMVKRYSHKGFADSMGRIIKGPRARHTWCGSHVRASVSRRRTPVRNCAKDRLCGSPIS